MQGHRKGRVLPPFLPTAAAVALVFAAAAAPRIAAAQGARAPAEPCAETLARIVEFASDKTTLDAAARALVRRQAKCLTETPAAKVTIEGYWDDSSTQAKARELSLRLATRVKDELVKGGVEESRLGTVGHGRERSLDPARPTERRRAVRVLTGG